jgi:hypothetical protein
MRYINRVAGLRSATTIGATGLAAGIMLAGGIGTVPALAGVTASQPLTQGTASAGLNSDRSEAVVVTGGDPGNGNGPKAITSIGCCLSPPSRTPRVCMMC